MRLVCANLCVAAACLLPLSPSLAEVSPLLDVDIKPEISSISLKNGLKVVVVSDHRAPTATQMVWYGVGSADEPNGKTGIAHFLEHLMFKGTDKVAPGDFSKQVARWGGVDNASTSYDYTNYFQTVPRDRLEGVMELEADRMSNLQLQRESVLTEREVILEERAQRIDSTPEGILHEQMFATLFMAHPYSHPIIGWEHEIRDLNRTDALRFYRKWYAPQNATLVLAGDITAEDGFALARRYYGDVAPPRPKVSRQSNRVQEPPHRSARSLEVVDERVGQEYLVRYYLIEKDVSDLEASAQFWVFAKVLGSGTTSWLYRDLVKDREVALSAGANIWDSGRDYAVLTVYAVPKDDLTLAQLEQQLEESLAQFARSGVEDEAVRREQNVLLASYVFLLDSQFSVASRVGLSVTNGLAPDTIVRWPQALRSVSAQQLREKAGEWLERERSVTGYLRKDKTNDGGDSLN